MPPDYEIAVALLGWLDATPVCMVGQEEGRHTAKDTMTATKVSRRVREELETHLAPTYTGGIILLNALLIGQEDERDGAGDREKTKTMGQLEVRRRKLARSVLPSEGRKTCTGLTHAESVGAHNHLIYFIV